MHGHRLLGRKANIQLFLGRKATHRISTGKKSLPERRRRTGPC